jgi:hypothetical protein
MISCYRDLRHAEVEYSADADPLKEVADVMDDG